MAHDGTRCGVNEKATEIKHEVFEPSFDWKECNDEHLVEQKLNYIHENASKGENRLVEISADYEHSLAGFTVWVRRVVFGLPLTWNCRI